MGHVYVKATLRGKRPAKVRFLVDTGATYSLVSPALADRIGITPSPLRDKVRLANGRTVRVPTALASLQIDGRETVAKVWIGPCDEPLLGAETLEALGMTVDPRRGKPTRSRPYASRLGGFGRR